MQYQQEGLLDYAALDPSPALAGDSFLQGWLKLCWRISEWLHSRLCVWCSNSIKSMKCVSI